MQTTFKEQIEAIQEIILFHDRKINSEEPKEGDPKWTKEAMIERRKILNDAGSTIAAVQLAPCPEWIDIQVKKDNLI